MIQNRFVLAIPVERAAGPIGNVGQVATDCGSMTVLQVDGWAFVLLDTVEKQPLPRPIHFIARLSISPVSLVGNFLDRFAGIAIFPNLEAAAVEHHGGAITVEADTVILRSVLHRMEIVEAAVRVLHEKTRKLPRCFHRIGCVGHVVDHKLATRACHGCGAIGLHRPEYDVDVVDSPVGEHAASIIKPP